MTHEEREALAQIGTPLISDALNRLNAINGLMRLDRWKGCMVGPALTVKTREGDNLALLHAISIAEPGQVIVVDGRGWTQRALVGDLARCFAISRGVAGFVIDGAARDVEAFATDEPFGCFARAVSHNGPFKDGPGQVHVPVAIGGQVVMPGDVIVADDNGIVAIPQGRVAETIAGARLREAAEDTIRNHIHSGVEQQPWLHTIMATAGSKIS